MKISELFSDNKQHLSFEVFPPNKRVSADTVYAAAENIAKLNPAYISVTYGAGGSATQQAVTLDLAKHIKEQGVIPLAHLTCINSDTERIDNMLRSLRAEGIENVLALRGDLVEGADVNPQYLHATDLIKHISEFGGFDIAAACYPEGHPDSEGVEAEIQYMKMKEDLGATHFISQLFFDNEDFYYMADLARRAGVKAPIQAGVMPVVNVRQIQRMVSTCGAKLPRKFSKIMARYGSKPEALFDAGISYAIEQIIDLLASGVQGIHVYAMNNIEVSRRIYEAVANML